MFKLNVNLTKILQIACSRQICPEMQVNKMHAIHDQHHKVSSFLKTHQNTHNSAKYEVIIMKMTLCDAYS